MSIGSGIAIVGIMLVTWWTMRQWKPLGLVMVFMVFYLLLNMIVNGTF